MRRTFDSATRLAVAALLFCVSSVFAGEPNEKLDEAAFEQLAPQLRLQGGMWDLPWQVSINDARRVAVREKKPIFLIVNTGNCLGFV